MTDHGYKIALVHDWLLGLGGAERVLKVLHEIFPEAPIYTFFFDDRFVKEFLPQAEIRASKLQGPFRWFKKHRAFLPFLPLAAESFDLRGFDLVISSSIAFSKGLILKPETKHLCYCYSPTRWLWDWHHEYLQSQPPVFKGLSRVIQHFLRIWDRQAAERVDQFVAISKHVQKRIKKYYHREAALIYPPLNVFPAVLLKPKILDKIPADYFLIVSRLFPHKNIEIAIEAFNKVKKPLVIVGDGPEYKKLKAGIGSSSLIRLVGQLSDQELGYCYANARALIMPQEEDFGLAPLEAMAFGKPVLALRRGGALEYVLEGINGEFFDEPHPAILADGLRRLNENYDHYHPTVIKKTAERFSRQRFEREIKETLTALV